MMQQFIKYHPTECNEDIGFDRPWDDDDKEVHLGGQETGDDRGLPYSVAPLLAEIPWLLEFFVAAL